MANPLYNPISNNPYAGIIAQAKEMQKTFKGNPKEVVQQLLNSGQMTQNQFNQLSQMAQQILPFMK